jgi:hypothetical protein
LPASRTTIVDCPAAGQLTSSMNITPNIAVPLIREYA